jgi:hypothetical protein
MNIRLQRNRLTIGATVKCRYFNDQDHRYYGGYFQAVVTDIWWTGAVKKRDAMRYEVQVGTDKVQSGEWASTHTRVLHRKEIKKVLVPGVLGLTGEWRKS